MHNTHKVLTKRRTGEEFDEIRSRETPEEMLLRGSVGRVWEDAERGVEEDHAFEAEICEMVGITNFKNLIVMGIENALNEEMEAKYKATYNKFWKRQWHAGQYRITKREAFNLRDWILEFLDKKELVVTKDGGLRKRTTNDEVDMSYKDSEVAFRTILMCTGVTNEEDLCDLERDLRAYIRPKYEFRFDGKKVKNWNYFAKDEAMYIYTWAKAYYDDKGKTVGKNGKLVRK